MAITRKPLEMIFFLLVVLCLNTFVARAEIKFKGDNYTIKCPAPDPKALGVYLYSRRETQREVLYYYFKTDKLTLIEDYEGRVQVRNDNRALTIDILNLQLTDAGTYWCTCNVLRSTDECPMAESGGFILVQEPKTNMAPSICSELLILVTALTLWSVFYMSHVT